MSDVNKQLLERWAAFGKAMQKSGSELPRHLVADTEQAIAAAEQAQHRCQYCDGTGDVHSPTGEWLGACDCESFQQAQQAQPVAHSPIALQSIPKRQRDFTAENIRDIAHECMRIGDNEQAAVVFAIADALRDGNLTIHPAAVAVPDERCPHCCGSGVMPKAAIAPEPPDVPCRNCNGTGKVRRMLAAQPPAVATDAITDAMEANAWRAALRGLCTGRELMTPDECAEHVRHRIESAKSGTHRPDGYVLVPIKPTDPMLDAAVSAGDEPGSDYYTIYAAMIAAAPQAASESAVQWPQERDVGRIGDMSKVASLRVGLDADNDVYVSIANEEGMADVEFCVPGSGGGKSPRTRAALISLMVAMEADNAETPSRDWWKAREGTAQKGGEA